jgi:hypothetical protein
VNNYAQIYTGANNTPNFTYKVKNANGVVETKSLPVINKAIQELFDPVYGRMNATLAVELPFSSATVATTIPLAYIDTPVERLDAIKDGETQIWKITHNGVDDHPVHFHLVNVQVINRVGWDGTVKPPEANEVGWKETLRMNPLEDVYVAVKAVHPVTPFGLPKSARLLDPSQLVNSTLGFTQIDPTTGQAPTMQTFINGAGVMADVKTSTYSNQYTDFDNEYVWHCHILGHEENDFMRPFIFHPNVVVPDAPTNVNVAGNTITWKDSTPVGGVDAQGIPTAGTAAGYPAPTSNAKNEIGFKVFDGNTLVATVPANTESWTDASGAVNKAYTVVAYNAAGLSKQGVIVAQAAPVAPAVLAAPTAAAVLVAPVGPTQLTQGLNAVDKSVTLTWAPVAGATGYVVSLNGQVLATVTDTTYVVPAGNLSAGGNNTFTVLAQTLNGNTAVVTSDLYNGAALPPVALTASQGTGVKGSITLTWANNPKNVNNVTGLTLTWNGGASSIKFAPTVTGATIINLNPDKDYTFKIIANSVLGDSAIVTVKGLSAP